MQVYVERGVSKGDCLQKIVKKHGIYFNILREKSIPSRFGGLITEKVEVEYYLSPQRGLGAAQALAWQGSSLQGSSLQGTPLQHSVPLQESYQAHNEPPAIPFNYRQPAASSQARNDTTLDFLEAKKRVLEAAGKNPDQVFQKIQGEEENNVQSYNQQLILDKLQEIQAKIETKKDQKNEHPHLSRIIQMLKQNDFSESYIAAIMERAHKELSLEVLGDFDAIQNRVLLWIGESIKIFPTSLHISGIPGRYNRSGHIIVLIGPTGVGKTTSIAKLAAMYSIENSERPPLSVRMITIDAFKIGAAEQIVKYCEIMEIPVSCIDNNRDLRREIDLYREETDLILIDTIGRSPKDSSKLGEMKELLDACGSKAEAHLVLSASTKTSDIEHILRQFEPFNYQAVMLTKLDETRHVGNVISALAERGKPVSYISDGQNVPKDIKKASVVRFLINLEEFRVDREEFEKRFPDGEANQF